MTIPTVPLFLLFKSTLTHLKTTSYPISPIHKVGYFFNCFLDTFFSFPRPLAKPFAPPKGGKGGTNPLLPHSGSRAGHRYSPFLLSSLPQLNPGKYLSRSIYRWCIYLTLLGFRVFCYRLFLGNNGFCTFARE